jgi:2-keto-4-pentenoate hydratase
VETGMDSATMDSATLDGATLAKAAEAIFGAREGGRPTAPISETFSIADADAAYQVQELNTQRWVKAGRKISGRKIGLTSKAVQAQFGIDQPDYGMLWGDGAIEAGQSVASGKFMQPRIEAEIAFILKKDLPHADVSMAEVTQAIDCALPAVEIVDSAIADWKIKLADTIADNASSGGYTLGLSPKTLGEVDLRLCGMIISKDGQAVSTGLGAACLGHPLNATLWLARTMARVGRPLEAGDVVLSGALGPMVSAKGGDRFLVEIQGFSPFYVHFEV